MAWAWLLQLSLIATGLGRSFAVQLFSYERTLGVFFFSSLLSNVGAFVLAFSLVGPRLAWEELRRPGSDVARVTSLCSFLDIGGMACIFFSLSKIGSGLHAIIYGSLPIWSAALRYLLLGKSISNMKIFYLLCVFVGLSIVPISEGLIHFEDSGGGELFVGMGLSLCSTVAYACLYVTAEGSLSKKKGLLPDDMDREEWNTSKSDHKALILMFWQCLQTLTILSTFLFLSGEEIVPSISSMITPGLMLVFFATSHTIIWLRVLVRGDSTSTSLLQGVRATANVLLSALFFCNTQSSQCLSIAKILSAAVVLSCVYLFNEEK